MKGPVYKPLIFATIRPVKKPWSFWKNLEISAKLS